MKLEYMFLADAGFAVSETGLFSVLNGGVNVVRCPTFPGTLHSLVLLGRMSFEPKDCGKTHYVDIGIKSPDGADLEPWFRDAELEPTVNPLGSDRQTGLTICFAFRQLAFPSPGLYTIQVRHKALGLLGQTSLDVIPI